MSTYIRSNSNRFYTAVETSYSIAAPVTSLQRFQASRLQAQQVVERGRRRDKTGTRTLVMSPEGRRRTGFELRTYLSPWTNGGSIPYGPLFQAALGADPDADTGATVQLASNQTSFTTVEPHGRSVGGAISDGHEIRFITEVLDAYRFIVNAPFSEPIAPGTRFTPTVTYRLATGLPSITIYDYWDPITTISRIVTGAAVDVMDLAVNGDRHDFAFSGPAADLIDSANLSPGTAGLQTFPLEPIVNLAKIGIVPGHLGQVWLGGTASQFFTLTEASVRLRNNIELRNQEFGSTYPRAMVPGPREVTTSFSLFAQDDAQTVALYSAAKDQRPITAMLQMGQQKGQLMGAYLPNVLPEMPTLDDSEIRLQWRFRNNFAQGLSDDELSIAFA